MVLAAQLRGGMVIRHEGQLCRVLAADYHRGPGRPVIKPAKQNGVKVVVLPVATA
ncbi:MAG TPA: hypothetical protein VGL72_29555 [Bryobacteraceae bacterium]|jgi:translation elongation factor P/translation initiation factor 5A